MSKAKRNVFAVARHNADNTQIAVSRNGDAPYMVFSVAELQKVAGDKALSIVAVQHWLKAKGIDATAMDLTRYPTWQTARFPYAVKVRAVKGN